MNLPRMIRRAYADALTTIVEAPLDTGPERDLRVWTFSGVRHLPEQAASLRSLLRNYGVPEQITVVSDGSHSRQDSQLLERIHERVSVVHYREVIGDDLPAAVARYAAASPMGVKLALEVSMPVPGPTMYSDADVLFYPGIERLGDDMGEVNGHPRYLQDFERRFLDERLLADPAESDRPTNAGILLLSERAHWEPALERLERLEGEPDFLTEQTVVHLAIRESGGVPLPGERYVLEVDDEHERRDRYAGPRIALRHYCYSDAIQGKLWLNVWPDVAAAARSDPRSTAHSLLSTARRWISDRSQRARA